VKPNTFQRLIHRFLMLAPVSAFLARSLHHLDALALRLSGGRWTVASLVGLPIVELTTIGAKSGQRRTIPLVSLKDGVRIALIGSNFGRAHHPAWYHNLKAHPECEVRWNGKTTAYLAREAQGQEREAYWQLAVSYYAGYEKYKTRAGKRIIPVMLLEPRR
jgi:deazaflavin-dependent oxidoreductase (nitroreductase family)